MALSGIQIYKMLPQTNCKECGFPTCLAFAMKLAAKQVELASCPYVSEESKAQLAESSAPPIRLVTLKSNGYEVKAGNEVVLFRHEKTFYNKPGIFIKVGDESAPEEIKARVAEADAYSTNYVGIDLSVDGFAVESKTGVQAFTAAICAVREASHKPLILSSREPAVMAEGLRVVEGEVPMIYAADASNWEAMADLAKQYKSALAVTAPLSKNWPS
jgi:acetyl-CoA decarbonylase/synthase, CODH/ACS complex subunit gamma